MHLGPADWSVKREATPQSPEIVVPKPRGSGNQRRLPGDFPSEAASARLPRAIGFRLVAGLSLPCAAARHALSPDWYRPVQIRRVQAERVDKARQKPGILEKGPALSRRDRLHDHPQSVDGDIGTGCR